VRRLHKIGRVSVKHA